MMDWTAITGAIDFSSVLTAISTIVVALAAVYLAVKGGSIVLGYLRR